MGSLVLQGPDGGAVVDRGHEQAARTHAEDEQGEEITQEDRLDPHEGPYWSNQSFQACSQPHRLVFVPRVIEQGQFTLRDMYEQFQNVMKLGPLNKVSPHV